MQENIHITQELKGIAPILSGIENKCPYATPAGYFDSLAETILINVKLNAVAETKNIYAVPAGYFESFADNVLRKIKTAKANASDGAKLELAEIAPLLNSISRKNVYSVPESYFDNFSIDPLILNEPARIISLASRFRKMLHYAVAASVLFVISGTSFLYVHQHTKNLNKSLSIEQRLATLNEDDIINYLKDDHQADDVSPTLNLQDNQLQNLLRNASDEEIEHYLDEENGSNEKNVKGI